MANFDFSTLNATDLEDLVCDLMNYNLAKDSTIIYKTFKEGRDKGIDFLYSSDGKDYDHVGQVKHYYRTGFNGMKSALIKTEVNKVKVLNPNKYIFATSVDLGVTETETIKNLFSPYIKSLGDIYGKANLNDLIEKYDKVLLDHYKLWFSDSSVLKILLNSGLYFKSKSFVEHELKRRIRLFVESPAFTVAKTALAKNNFIVITGEPGVGKTTLAEMLSYEFIKDDYELTYIESADEADDVLVDDDSKQLIYFDDFLGSTKVEINNAKGSETKLRRILRFVSRSENKRMIMTTRTFLLTTALEESETLKRFNIRAKESTLNVKDYSISTKRQLIINHIDDSDLEDSYKSVLRIANLVDFMASHKYFNPRTVEFVTSLDISGHIDPSKFEDYVRTNFNEPDKIWSHAFHYQINELERLFLSTLVSFKSAPIKDDLKQAFISRLKFEEKFGRVKAEVRVFEKTYRILLGGFIVETHSSRIDLLNPSLRDFLNKEVLGDDIELIKIAETLVYINQLRKVSPIFLTNGKPLPTSLNDKIISDRNQFITDADDDIELVAFASILADHNDVAIVEKAIVGILNEIVDWEWIAQDYEVKTQLEDLVVKTRGVGEIASLIDDKVLEILHGTVLGEYEPKEAIDLLENLVNNLNINLATLDRDNLEDHISSIINSKIDEEIEFLSDYATSEGEMEELSGELQSYIDRAKNLGLRLTTDMDRFDDLDWWEITTTNEMRRQMEKND
jgi:KaiC/GvpD/RAD55 family RecA-like ATPase